jgi:hypothetical protein
MCEFQYKINEEWRVRVIFDSLREKFLTKCKMKVYCNNELIYVGLGISFCMDDDEWNDAEGRKWAFIDAIRNTMPRKSQAIVRKELQREYIKSEKKWEAELCNKLSEEGLF